MPSLTTLTQSNELQSAMWPRLLRYAQSFERYEPFKQDMGASDANCEYFSKKVIPLNDTVQVPNPFLHPSSPHLVEHELLKAFEAAKDYDFTTFKCHRANVLHYLEIQYLQILLERNIFKKFLKETTEGRSLLGGAFQLKWTEVDSSLALVHLENYSRAFNRHLDLSAGARIIKHGRSFDQVYSCLPREVAIKTLFNILDLQSFEDLEDFRSVFRFACDDMDEQLSEILSAKKDLFLVDIGKDKLCGIDLELGLGQISLQWA